MSNVPPRASSLLVIRFSSFGDIAQAIGVPGAFIEFDPQATVDWLVRSDFSELLLTHPLIRETIPFSRSAGFLGLIQLAWKLGARNYTHVYDAHNNVRSRVVVTILRFSRLLGRSGSFKFARRPKDRLRRWLLFRFRIRALPWPFRAADSFHRPLVKWNLSEHAPSGAQFFTTDTLPEACLTELNQAKRPLIVLAPSAAWEMKRWPIEHWQELVRLLPEASFAILGGPEDQFVDAIVQIDRKRCLNFAGRLTLAQSSTLLKYADLVIANDTGILHVSDQMDRPTIALIGPTAFGYPSHASSATEEIHLSCKPCTKDGRGKCINSLYKRCLVDLSPKRIAQKAIEMLKAKAAR
jgi:ADP-heptose:LPS heptosyltransferase